MLRKHICVSQFCVLSINLNQFVQKMVSHITHYNERCKENSFLSCSSGDVFYACKTVWCTSLFEIELAISSYEYRTRLKEQSKFFFFRYKLRVFFCRTIHKLKKNKFVFIDLILNLMQPCIVLVTFIVLRLCSLWDYIKTLNIFKT